MLVLVFLAAIPSYSAGLDSAGVIDSFRQNARREWTRHRELSSSISGSSELTIRRTGDNAAPEVIKESIKASRGRAVGIHEKPMPTTSEFFVFGYNDRYGFSLKKGQKDAASWVVTDIILDKGSKEWRSITRFVKPINSALTFIGSGDSVERHLFDPKTNVSLVKTDNRLVTLLFEPDQTGQNPSQYEMASITATFDPSHYWILKNWKIVFRNGWVSEAVVESRIVDGFPIVLRRTAKDYSAGNSSKPEAVGTETFDVPYPSKPPPSSDFTLSAFGLPEPWSGASSDFSILVVIAVIGVICIAAGIGIRLIVPRFKAT